MTRRIKPVPCPDTRQMPTHHLRTQTFARLQSSSARPPPLPIAIIGGGIAGITAALQLSRRLPPDRRIILYEAQERLGGWIESDVVEYKGQQSGSGTVVLEGGPRSIRPKGLSGWTMVELVRMSLRSRCGILRVMNLTCWLRDRSSTLPDSFLGPDGSSHYSSLDCFICTQSLPQLSWSSQQTSVVDGISIAGFLHPACVAEFVPFNHTSSVTGAFSPLALPASCF